MNQKTLTQIIIFVALSLSLMLTSDVFAKSEIPDLSGTYDVSTLTPLNRPAEFGNKLELTPEQANKIILDNQIRVADRSKNRGPVTQAPPSGGAPPIGIGDEFRESSGAGNVGGYNNFWVDPGSDVIQVNGTFRTSIIISGFRPNFSPAFSASATIKSPVAEHKLLRAFIAWPQPRRPT